MPQGDYATALKHWRPLAKQGHAKAQYNLGTMHEHGRGGLAVNEAILWLGIKVAALSLMFAKLRAAVTSFVFNFVVCKMGCSRHEQ